MRLVGGGFERVVFLDAVDFGSEPGAVTLLNAVAMKSRFPQVSTHRLSLGALAQCAEQLSDARVWLLGIQPGSLREGGRLSAAVAATLGLLTRLLREAGRKEAAAC
jgi:hydrogenase maturation protease